MTPEQIEIVKRVARDLRADAEDRQYVADIYGTQNEKGAEHSRYAKVYRYRATALEALLAEREELIKDKARLDWLESRNCGFDHIKWGEYHHYSYPENEHGLERARAAIDAAMKEGEE